MTSATDLGKILELHKKLIGQGKVFLSAAENRLRISSTASNGMVLISRMASDGEFDACVDLVAFAAFARGSNDVVLSVKDRQLFIKGKGIKGDLPIMHEDAPVLPKSKDTLLDPDDVDWLRENLPLVNLSGLDKSGVISASCTGSEWRLSCVDDIHGACAFGTGKSKIKFSLYPSDLNVLQSLINAVSDKEEVAIGFADGAIYVKAGRHLASIPVLEGTAQSKEDVIKGTKAIAKFKGTTFKDVLQVLAPIASAKDAPGILVKIAGNVMTMEASSSAGSIEKAMRVEATEDAQFRLSFKLIADLSTKLGADVVGLRVLHDGDEVSRITLRYGNVHLLMLTSV